jgi:hypothetical protein
MADRITSFVALTQVASAFLNTLQDRTISQRAGNSNNDVASANGFEARLWWPTGLSLAAATTVELDKSIDWRDRFIVTIYAPVSATNLFPGQANDYDFRTTFPVSWKFSAGYTGSGAYSNVATGAAVTNGAGPLASAGVFRSYTVEPDGAAGSTLIWVKPGTGELNLYNAAGAAIRPALLVLATGKLGKR